MRCGAKGCGPADGVTASSVQWRLDCRLGAGHGEVRTWNMPFMSVTLEVSKLSGWLNALAYCRESKEGHAMRGKVPTGRWRATAVQAACMGRDRLQIGSRARGGAHYEPCFHGCDAGGVEAQRLVERRRFLPRVGRSAYGGVQGAGRGRREAAGNGGARSVQERDRLQIGGRARGGTHCEHVAHVCDAGGVEAKRLVERRRELPRVERRAYGAGRRAAREAEGGRRRQLKQRAGWRARLQIGSRARGGAHVEDVVHVCDARGVEAQRLVERQRALPSRKAGVCDAGRGVGREAADDRGASSVQEGLDCRLGAWHGEERTENMLFMAVTPEVSQLDMSALKFCKP